ncbi:hypothetical protein HMPREF9370_1533 [Neisseria wadsworthii 9715]|uniref:Uncharacterized protein n=1 Tax=Neisseria wadsworthii 9715 TaxID=1030841 RepID=G4CR23_9NEIS|nr:hypothetical protein HMPREF9370_1533 [Neisseria wadsworthii 9715]
MIDYSFKSEHDGAIVKLKLSISLVKCLSENFSDRHYAVVWLSPFSTNQQQAA